MIMLTALLYIAGLADWASGLPLSSQTAAPSQILNSSYVSVKFGQSLSSITSYSNESMSHVAAQKYYPFGYERNALTSLAQWDLEHNSTAFEGVVKPGNAGYESKGSCHSYYGNISFTNQFNDYPMWTALGVLEQDAAYGGNAGLTQAKNSFQFVTDHGYVSEADIQAGYLLNTKPKNVTLQSTCQGKSLLGGVYWQNGCPQDSKASELSTINAVATGLYSLVGARLCRLTSNTTYCDAAYSTLQFMDRVLKNENGLIEEQVDAHSCSRGASVTTHDTALYMAAYAELGNYTNNATALSLGRTAAINSMTTSKWNDPRGILTGAVGSNLTQDSWPEISTPSLIRFLQSSAPYFDAPMQAAILQYINIQYWAITQLDSDDPTHPVMYGRNWTGPGFELATDLTNNAALIVLNALPMNPTSAFPKTTNTSAPVAYTVAANSTA